MGHEKLSVTGHSTITQGSLAHKNNDTHSAPVLPFLV